MPSTGTFCPVLPRVTIGRPAGLVRAARPRRRASARRGGSTAGGRGRSSGMHAGYHGRQIHRESLPPWLLSPRSSTVARKRSSRSTRARLESPDLGSPLIVVMGFGNGQQSFDIFATGLVAISPAAMAAGRSTPATEEGHRRAGAAAGALPGGALCSDGAAAGGAAGGFGCGAWAVPDGLAGWCVAGRAIRRRTTDPCRGPSGR